MKPVCLIALNYLREQRWPLILLVAWVVISAVLSSAGQPDPDDTLFFIKQLAIYGAAVIAFLAASAIYNDRRSRRILAVLSKGIERGQYLAGLLCGVLLVAGTYCAVMAVFGSMMFHAIGMPATQLVYLLALLIVSCALLASVAILFSTFTPPLIATGLTAVALGVGMGFAEAGFTHNVLPAGTLMRIILEYEFAYRLRLMWEPVAWALVQAVLLVMLATWIFERRDIAVAVE